MAVAGNFGIMLQDRRKEHTREGEDGDSPNSVY